MLLKNGKIIKLYLELLEDIKIEYDSNGVPNIKIEPKVIFCTHGNDYYSAHFYGEEALLFSKMLKAKDRFWFEYKQEEIKPQFSYYLFNEDGSYQYRNQGSSYLHKFYKDTPSVNRMLKWKMNLK